MQQLFILTTLFIFNITLSAQTSIEFEVTEPTCNGYTNGEITATPSGGNAPYQYFWSNGQAGQTTFGVTGGNYSVTVSDNTGTTSVGTIMINQPDLLEISVIPDGDICDGNMGTFTAEVSGGTAPFAFEWSNGQMTQTVENLPIGFYFVTVTDINGCKAVATAGVNGPLTVDVVTIDVACFGYCDGSVNAVIDGGIPPYAFLWNNGSTDPIQGMLPIGDYSVTVTDGNGCTATGIGTIGDPDPLNLDIEITNQCVGNSSINVTTTGSIPPYTYHWAHGPTTPSLTNLSQGTYFLTVTDANNCKTDTSIVISEGVLSIISGQMDATCPGASDGWATVNPIGGVSPFSFVWNTNPPQTTEMASGLTAGNYSVTITDAGGCTAVNNVVIGEGNGLETEILQQTDATCAGINDGSATVNPITGIAPFSFIWSTAPPQTMATAIELAIGEYFVTVTDSTGCVAIDTVIIGAGFELEIEISQKTDATCAGVNDGSATVNPINGIAPYSFLWNTEPPQTTATATELAAGEYSVTVTDAAGCIAIENVTIGEGDPLIIEFSTTQPACDGTGGTATIENVINGTAPFTYNWNTTPTQMSQTATGLASGVYTVLVIDANGCEVSDEIEIEDENSLTILIDVENASCENTPDGSVIIQNIGSNPVFPLTYEWCHSSSEIDSIANDLLTGFYCVTVTDAAGCSGSVDSIFVDFDSSIDAAMTWEVDSCVGDSILITFSDASAFSPASDTIIDWQWTFNNGIISDESTVQFFSSLDTIIAELIVTNATGCNDTITEIVPFDLGCDLYPDTLFVCVGDSLQIEPIDSCMGIIGYNWSPDSVIIAGQNTANPIIIGGTEAMILQVKISNNLGCSFSETIFVELITDDKQLAPEDISSTQCDSTTLDFTVINSDIECYTWVFDYPNFGDTGTGQNPSFTYSEPGIYTVALVPNFSCLDTVFKEIMVEIPPIANFITDFEPCQEEVEVTLTDNSTTPTPITSWLWTLSNGVTSTAQNEVVTIDSCQELGIQLIIGFGAECFDTTEQSIYVPVFNNQPNLPDTLLVCAAGDTISLNPNGNPDLEYSWSPSAQLDDSTAVNPLATISETTLFTAIVTSTECAMPCSTEMEVLVILPDSMGLLLPEDIEVCQPTDEIITVTTEVPSIIEWSFSPDFEVIEQSSEPNFVTENNFNFFINDTLLIYTQSRDQYGCSSIDSILVGNYEIIADPADATNFCFGDTISNIQIDNLTAVDSVIWSPENPTGTIPSINDEEFTITNYDITIVNDKGCTFEETIEISVQHINNILEVIPPVDTIIRGQSVAIEATFDSDYNYNWTPTEGLNDPAANDPIAMPAETITYNLEVTDDETQCRGDGSSMICVIDEDCGEPMIFVPNTFTPNGDGLNDVFQVRGLNIKSMELLIFNRWGEKVFESRSQEKAWDGTFNGKMVSGDVYGYYLEVTCAIGGFYSKKGNVTVIR